MYFLEAVPANTAILTTETFSPPANATFVLKRNDIHVTYLSAEREDLNLGMGGETDGPFVNQDFYMQFKWTPPTRNGFVIAITGLYTSFASSANVSNSNTTGSFVVPAGSTGFLAGPMRVTSPTSLENDADSFEIAYSVSLQSAGAATDSSWYALPNAVEIVQFQRHRFAVINWDGSDVTLLSTGQKSRPFCIAPAFTGALSSTDQVWLSVVPDQGFVIFDPVTPVAGAQPPNALLLSAASPIACFTARFDTNWQFLTNIDDRELSDLDTGVVVRLSGPSGFSVQDQVVVSNMPDDFEVALATMSLLSFSMSPFTDIANVFKAGESSLLWVTIQVPPPRGFSYNLTLPGSIIEPVSAGAGTFAVDGDLQQLWRVTFFVLPVAEGNDDHDGQFPLDEWDAKIRLVKYGADAVYYSAPAMSLIAVIPRIISIYTAEDSEAAIGSGVGFGALSLDSPVVNGLTVTLRMRGSGAASGGVRFVPASFEFAPNGAHYIEFAVIGDVLGTHEWSYSLSGPDQYIFRVYNENEDTKDSLTVVRRQAPELNGLADDDTLVAGIRYGPIELQFDDHDDGEDVSVTLDFGSDFVLSKSVFDAGADGSAQYFDVTWVPSSDDAGGARDSVLLNVVLGGADAWKYEPVSSINVNTRLQRYAVNYAAGEHVVGVRYTGNVQLLDGVTPAGFRAFLLSTGVQYFAVGSSTPAFPFVVSFADQSDGTTQHFEYIVSAPVTQASADDDDNEDEFSAVTSVQTNSVLDGSAAGNAYYASHPTADAQLVVRRRAFYFDLTNSAEYLISNPQQATNFPAFMVNRESPLYTITLTAPPVNAVTLTISHPNLQFNGGQPAATLVYAAGQLTASLSFMPISIPHNQPSFGHGHVNVAVSGVDAALYDYSDIFNKMQVVIIPELNFSPIPAIYTDGSAEGLKVWLVDAVAQGFPYGEQASFSLHIKPTSENVYVEPSVLHFSASALASNRLSQQYSLYHVRPSEFGSADSYGLQWTLKYAGLETGLSLNEYGFVPLDAQNVILSRHQIVPEFPNRLNFGWQKASINVSRAPNAHMTLIPHGPVEDGQLVAAYGGAHTAGGRIVFEPAVVVFAPGQQVAHFRVKAIPGSDQNAVYYRVQWQITGHEDDLYNYLDYVNARADADVTSHFATFHVAAATLAQLSLTALAIVALLLAL